MRTFSIFTASLCLFAASAAAEEIVLKDGTALYGRLVRDGDQLAVVDSAGNAVVLDGEVEKISSAAELREQLAIILEKSGGSPDRWSLGCWCWKRGLFDEGREQFSRLLEADPDNPAVRFALGHLKVKGLWVESGVWTRLPGNAESWVRWFPGAGKGRLQVRVGEKPDDARDALRKACKRDKILSAEGEKELARMKPPELREGLLLALKDPSRAVRMEAARRLAKQSGAETAGALAAAALCDSDGEVRSAALASLSAGAFPEARDLIVDGLDQGRLDIRMNAIQALAAFPARETIEALTAVLESGKPRIPRVNIFCGRHTAYVSDFDAEVSSAASIGDPVIASQMEGAVLDVKVISVEMKIVRLQRSAARRSLRRIAGRDLGASVEAWRKWAEENFAEKK